MLTGCTMCSLNITSGILDEYLISSDFFLPTKRLRQTGRDQKDFLNTLFLTNKDLLSHPILYLRKYIINNKDSYCRCLNGVSINNDLVFFGE